MIVVMNLIFLWLSKTRAFQWVVGGGGLPSSRRALSATSTRLLKSTLGGRTTAGIIVIGDEILKGSTRDSNSNFMCKRLHDRGVAVKKISVIGDGVDEIADEVRTFSQKYDIVFTTGGIGPTHDDLTFAGLAKAFNDELHFNRQLKSVVDVFLQKHNISDVDDAVEKFCRIPKTARLIWSDASITFTNTSASMSESDGIDDNGKKAEQQPSPSTIFPSFQIQNVIALPGVPSFCERTFEKLEEYLFPSDDPDQRSFFTRTLFLQRNELHLERELSRIADDHAASGVTIGSYPVEDNNYFKTKLIVEGLTQGESDAAHIDLSTAFKDYVVSYDETPWLNTIEKMNAFRHRQSVNFQRKLDDALQTIDDVLDQYRMNEISLSFNGGKDCTILLHLFRVCVDRRYGAETPLNGFHVSEDEFPSVCEFIDDVSKKYRLRVEQIDGPLRKGLERLKRDQSRVIAVLMGSRATDPRGKYMKSRCEWTDNDWPRFYRCCPIFLWSYSEVWRALRGLCVPYCSLYDQGYTSLGQRSVTRPNPALQISGEPNRYLPAYCLEKEELERCSRENSTNTLLLNENKSS